MNNKKIIYLILSAVAISAASILTGLYLMQSRFVYFPDSQDFSKCPGFSDSQILDLAGTRAYYKGVSDKLVVFYHGNAGSACDRAYLKDEFEKMNYSTLMIEYAGYSNDESKPNKEALMKDVINVSEYLNKRKYSKLIIMGESLGTGLASLQAGLVKADGVVLISPFNRFSELAKRQFSFFPVMLLKENYDNQLALSDYKGRVLVIHGDKDQIIPYADGKSLYESFLSKDNKKMITVNSAGHNDIYSFKDTWDSIYGFLTE